MTAFHRYGLSHRGSGFTLVEIAMVLFIITLLLTGLVPTINAQLEKQRIDETRRKMGEMREALIGYALRTGTLPCPAQANIATGSANAGVSVTPPCTGVNSYGVAPWSTLGTSETDGWGNRFSYRVTDSFADSIASGTYGGCTPSPTPAQSSFAICSAGNITIRSSAGGAAVASTIPAVIVSHGKNGAGAWTSQGTQPTTSSSDADEQDNIAHSTNADYVSHIPTATFDDIVDWVPPAILVSKMVSAGRLP